jgi:hypothetical protein
LPPVPPGLSPERAPVTLYPQKRRTIVLALVSAVFVVVGALAAADGAPIGWAAVGFFGLCLLVFLALGRFVARSLSGVDGGLPDNTYGLEAEELARVLNVWRDRYA